MFGTTLALRSKYLAHCIYFTVSKKVLLENFRILSFTLPSKVQIQLLSCIKSYFASLSTFKYYTILIFLNIAERFFTVTTFEDSQYYQDKNVLLVDYLISQDSCVKSSFLETNLLEFSKFGNELEVKDYLLLHLN